MIVTDEGDLYLSDLNSKSERKIATNGIWRARFVKDGLIAATRRQETNKGKWTNELLLMNFDGDVVSKIDRKDKSDFFLEVSGNGRYLVLAPPDQGLSVYSVSQGAMLKTIRRRESPPLVATDRSGLLIAECLTDWAFRILRIDEKTKEVSQTLGPTDAKAGRFGLSSLGFGHGQLTLATGGYYGNISLWDTKKGSRLTCFKIRHGAPIFIYPFADGRILSVLQARYKPDEDAIVNRIAIFDKKGREIFTQRLPSRPIDEGCAHYNAETGTLAVGVDTGKIVFVKLPS